MRFESQTGGEQNVWLWLNSQNFHNFRDAQGHPAVPYLLAFKTSDKAEASATSPATEKHDEAEKQALAAAESWLALVDDGKYGESWDAAAEYLKSAVGKADFESRSAPPESRWAN